MFWLTCRLSTYGHPGSAGGLGVDWKARVGLFEQLRQEHEFCVGTIAGVVVKFGLHRRMVRQAIAGAIPPPRRYPVRARPKLDAVACFVDRVLDEGRRGLSGISCAGGSCAGGSVVTDQAIARLNRGPGSRPAAQHDLPRGHQHPSVPEGCRRGQKCDAPAQRDHHEVLGRSRGAWQSWLASSPTHTAAP